MAKAVYSAKRERSVGLGLMGFHSFLQEMGMPFESAAAKSWNIRLFKHIRMGADAASVKLAEEKRRLSRCGRMRYQAALQPQAGDRADGVDLHHLRRASPCIEPIPANVYTHKTLSGSFTVKNRHLSNCLTEKAEHGRHLGVDP